MLQLGSAISRSCQGVTRRHMLQIAGIDLLGISLADSFRSPTVRANERQTQHETSCIFIWLNGGPSQFETFDPKPNTSETIRGPFGAIQTQLPGVAVSELIPMLARRIDKYAVIRSMTHRNTSHGSTAMLTGFDDKQEAFGAVATKFKGSKQGMPPYVHIGSTAADATKIVSNIDKVGGGQFGSAYDPLAVRDPTGKNVKLSTFSLPNDISANRLQQRQELLGSIDEFRRQSESSRAIQELARHRQQAVDLLTSTRLRDAFDLEKDDRLLRARYGANFFGQACMMARRLVEAGTRYVQIKWYDIVAYDAWDCHGAELPGMMRMEQQLCPRLDQGLSALFDDLDDRGLLDSTLVVVAGEFGRTPKLNKNGARDHWPYCYSALMAGAGIPGGTIVGTSDRTCAAPSHRPVSPTEFAATIYHLLGIDTTRDSRIRPFIGSAIPIRELIG
ncbi:MAG: hypothetical protein CMJ64_30265 [Planctomycetaceae bacterium]|nr:hypothetical protein [Planctomycetaceae bacterium]